MALNNDIHFGKVFIGADARIDAYIKQEDETTPQDMTGWALLFVVRAGAGTATAIVSKTTGSGITITNGEATNDRAVILINRNDTLGHIPGDYNYALWRTDDGFDVPLAFGTINLTSIAVQ